MDTNVKNSQPAIHLQPTEGGEIVIYQPDNNIRLEVQLDPDSQTVWLSQVVVRENRTTTRHGAIEDKNRSGLTERKASQ